MSKDFIPHQEALELKELGFNESCFGKYDIYGVFDHKLFYHNHDVETEYVGCSAPLYQQAFRWFENNHSMFIERIVTTTVNEILDIEYHIKSWKFNHITIEFNNPYDCFDKKEAELACLRKLIEIVKNK